MLLPYTINSKTIDCPTNWHEVSLELLLKLEGKNIYQKLAIVTGLSVGEIKALEPQIDQLFGVVLQWMTRQPDFSKIPLPQEFLGHPLPFDPKKKTFGQKLYAQQIVTLPTAEKIVQSFPELIGTYLTDEFNDERIEHYTQLARDAKAIEAVPIALWLQKEVIKILESENKLLKNEPTNEERRAGLKNFDKFGSFNLIDTLAGGDILKHDAIYQQNYERIFIKLLRDLEVSKFQRRLNEIYSQRK